MTSPEPSAPASDELVALAESYGVSTDFHDYRGNHTRASVNAVVAVLDALGVSAHTPEAIAQERRAVELAPWRVTLPACVVVRQETGTDVPVHVPHGTTVTVEVRHAQGAERTADLPGGTVRLEQREIWVEPREVDGVLTGRATFHVPPGLPLGWFELAAHLECGATVAVPLAVTPERLPHPRVRAAGAQRGWGIMAQLYSTRSRGAWGVGDAADLATLTHEVGTRGGDFVLINPLHAAEPSGPMTPSPYLPASRRFINPIYIRPQEVPEAARLTGEAKERFDELMATATQASLADEIIDRTASWAAKQEALELVFALGLDEERRAAFDAYRAEQGGGLEDFALWSALAEAYRGREFPSGLADVTDTGVAAAREEHAERQEFFAWLQWIVDEQLAAAQATARDAGMGLGIMHDLAVGVHPTGADVWTMPTAFAHGVTVGAPPDYYNQLGQDWSQPPWRPDTLAATAYRPVRDMVRTVLRHAGALRIDHIMGFFRLWWIPAGMGPRDGVYVRYDHEAMIGVLLLEAQLAGATLVGEDLGTVEPWVREYLTRRGILGTSVFWFEKDDSGRPRAPHDYREGVLATVNTHDLPPVAGYLDEEHVDLRQRLGLLVDGEEQARAEAREERARVAQALREEGLLPDDGTPVDDIDRQDLIDAIHAFVARTPARLVAVSLTDVVGERRAQNQPGTNDEYPNWRVPLADGAGQIVLLDDLGERDDFDALLRVVRENIG